MKRVVTGLNAAGRSCVVSSEEVAPGEEITIWNFDPSSGVPEWVDAIDPKLIADWIGPQVAGGGQWIYATLPAGVVEQGPGIDENGFHTTRTIDFDFVVEGDLTLILDEHTVQLHQGDFVVQQATRHAWRTESEEPAILLVFMLRPPGSTWSS